MLKTSRMMTWGRKGMRYMSDMTFRKRLLDVNSDNSLKCALADYGNKRYPLFVSFVNSVGINVARELIVGVRAYARDLKLDPDEFATIINDICTAYYSVDVLDEVECRYLKQVIRPFRRRIKYIQKRGYDNENEYLVIKLNGDMMCLPNFTTDSMYRGMIRHKEYTLEELGL